MTPDLVSFAAELTPAVELRVLSWGKLEDSVPGLFKLTSPLQAPRDSGSLPFMRCYLAFGLHKRKGTLYTAQDRRPLVTGGKGVLLNNCLGPSAPVNETEDWRSALFACLRPYQGTGNQAITTTGLGAEDGIPDVACVIGSRADRHPIRETLLGSLDSSCMAVRSPLRHSRPFIAGRRRMNIRLKIGIRTVKAGQRKRYLRHSKRRVTGQLSDYEVGLRSNKPH